MAKQPDAVDPALAALARVRASARSAPAQRRATPQFSGSGSDGRDPVPLGQSLGRWIREHGYDAELAAAGLIGRWPQIVGEQVAAHVSVTSFTPDAAGGGTLTVQADSPEWAVQLGYLLGQLRQRIDAELGAGVVTRIEITRLDRRSPGRWRARSGRRPR